MKISQEQTKILNNLKVANRYYKLSLFSPQIARNAQPGQFVMIKVSDSSEPLLRRPFSIQRVENKKIGILYEVVGKGTEALAQKKAGEYLDIIGPSGNGFSLFATRYSLLIAGGIGVAPLLFLAEKLQELKTHNPQLTTHNPQLKTHNSQLITILLGAKTKNEILCEKEFKELGCDVKIATDDGSWGFKGKVTGLLNYQLSTINYQLSTLYACGPRPMLKEISWISNKYKIPAQISLDEHMACGMGACLGCVIKIANRKSQIANHFEYKRVCKDGPVFYAEEIIWE